ncbi:MAG: NfeD family protein [Planctomycetaceae bacterium]
MSRSVEAGADLIIFEIHSPGGQLAQVRDLAIAIALLQDRDIRTVAWVPEMATGEAAIVALGCDEIYLTPEATFGAVGRRRDFNFDDSSHDEKAFLMQTMQELAELKRRPAAVLLAMADPTLQVFQATERATGIVTYKSDEELDAVEAEWIRGPQVAEAGNGLLTVTGLRAQQLLVAEPPVESFDEVRQRVGLGPDIAIRRVQKQWVDDLVFTLNRPVITGMLFALAFILIYLEVHMMTGGLGIAAVLCISLFFWSRFLGGTAGALEIVLFILGLAFLAMEVFVIPGFGVFGLSGGALLILSLVLASQTFGNIEPGRDFSQATETMKLLSVAVLVVLGFGLLVNQFLPKLPFMEEMVLKVPGTELEDDGSPRLRPELANVRHELVGARGEAATMLRPAGKARIEGRLRDVVSEGPFIESGSRVEVVSVQGNHVVVREC